MKRLAVFLFSFFIWPNLCFSASYLGKDLDGIPLKCSLTTIDDFKVHNDITCIFHANSPNSIELKFNEKTKRIYRFNSTNGRLFDLSQVAIYNIHENNNDQHNFDLYGVLKITPPDSEKMKKALQEMKKALQEL